MSYSTARNSTWVQNGNRFPKELPSTLFLVFLGTQCTEQNCTGDVFEQCEHDIRVSNGKALADFDRHQLLRIKLDASKKLLHYPETRSEEECLLIRAILADLFVIHQRYCFHSVVTQCLCERLSLNRFCSIDCAALQHEKPTDDKLIWSNLEDRVGEYASSAISTLTSALSTALLALTSLVAVGNIL
uniref:Uncharacterized protein n=1 Tax=Plectus sambesii TaxID=2011161 RepID=A0A914XVR6_9BILA